jgi:hypothetical protein
MSPGVPGVPRAGWVDRMRALGYDLPLLCNNRQPFPE